MDKVKIDAIYKHYKKGDLYRVKDIVYDHETNQPAVVYYRCDKNGVFKSIRNEDIIIGQPFVRTVVDWIAYGIVAGKTVQRFTFYKQL